MGLLRTLVALIFFTSSTLSSAALIVVNFAFDNPSATHGSFSYQSSLQGQVLSYADLMAFSISALPATGNTYDLAFVNSPACCVTDGAPFRYFGFDTATDQFVPAAGDAPFFTIISAIGIDGISGFFVGGPGNNGIFDYASQDLSTTEVYRSVSVASSATTAPEPGTLTLLLAGLAAIGFRRKRKTPIHE